MRLAIKIVVGIIMSLVLLVCGVLIALRTEWGHRTLLAKILPVVQKSINGRLVVGHLGGTLTGALVIDDIALYDDEGQLAASAKKITLRYGLFSLLHHRLDVASLDAKQLYADVRYVKNGQVNFASIFASGPPSPPSPPSAGKPFVINVDKVRIDADGRYDPNHPTAPKEPDRSAAHLEIEGGVKVVGSSVDFHVERLSVDSTLPCSSHVEITGAATIDGTKVSIRKGHVVVDTIGHDIDHFIPEPYDKLHGAYHADVTGDGTLSALKVTLGVKLPKGTIDSKGVVAIDAKGANWDGALEIVALDPAAVAAGMPRGRIDINGRAKGRNGHGTVDDAHVIVDVEGVRAQAEAHGKLDGTGDAKVSLWASDLARLNIFGIKGLGGTLKVDGRVQRDSARLAIDAVVHGNSLRAPGDLHARMVDIDAHTVDFGGRVHVHGEHLRVQKWRFGYLTVNASGDRRGISLDASAEGPRNAVLALALHGTRRGPRGADLTLDHLRLAGEEGPLVQTSGASRIEIDPTQVAIHDFNIQYGSESLALDGHYRFDQSDLGVSAHARHLDAHALASLVTNAELIPKSELDADIDAHGPVRALVATVAVRGKTQAFSWERGARQIKVAPLALDLQGHYGNQRASAKGSLSSNELDLQLDADVPIAHFAEQPFKVNVAINKLPIDHLAPLLPPRMALLTGNVSFKAQAQGTVRAPNLKATLDVPWAIGDFKHNQTHLDVAYDGAKLVVHHETSLAGKSAGDLQLTATADLPAESLTRFKMETLHTTPIDVQLALEGVDLVKLDLPNFGIDPPFSEGKLALHVKLSGTLHDPVLNADVRAKGLAHPGVIDQLDLHVAAQYQARAAALTADISLEGGKLFDLKANGELDAVALLDGKKLKVDKLHLEAKTPSYDLARLAKLRPQLADLHGALDMTLTADGTPPATTARMDTRLTNVRMMSLVFPAIDVSAALANQKITATADAKQETGGHVSAKATLPLDANQALSAEARVDALDLAFLPGILPMVRKVKGQLNASLEVKGTRAHLAPSGHIELKDAALTPAGDSHSYDQIALELAIAPGSAKLEKLAIHSDGWLRASGSAVLDGWQPKTFSVDANSRHFLVALGSAAAWLDSEIVVRGEKAGKETHVTATVKKGFVNLPKIETGRALQSTDPLKYVKYDDKRARKAEAVQEAAGTAEIVAKIPGPFQVRSKEADFNLKGDLTVSITGNEVRLNGSVDTESGWIELLSRRYQLDRVAIAFSGEPDDPAIDVRISRQMTDATIIIGVHGTGKHPKLELVSDPPIYDESQILGIVLSGDPAAQRTSDQSLDSKVVGAISGLVVGKLKDAIMPSLPIDVIKIDTGGDDYAGLTDTRVEVGKYITENIYISYVHQFGAAAGLKLMNNNEGRAEYRFKRRYALDASFGDNGVGGLDLFWTIRY